ncbi:MAG: SDR family oxidoreductase [Candidatus Marinimicrobia bacterium]|nr:SDR family oxidoreductase [Candidatus Neomarinimicrobiota bacterium]MCF7840505.1 SDR family oxidoreductase [Candidatus Neomarinimicrobiota bacterium]
MFKTDLLKDKVIFITGGGTGLGRAMATRFLELGAHVIIASRKLEVLEKTAAELEAAIHPVGSILPLELDVRDYRAVESALEQTLEKFGRVDVLVNNAAGNFVSPTERLSNKAFDVVVDIVLRGSYNCTLAFGKHWIDRQQKARVLNIVTTYAWTGSGYVVPSAISKAGVLAMTRSLAVEWAKYGITMNAIAPGPFPTKGAWSRLVPPGVEEKMVQRIPLGRVGDHSELGNLAAFLVSDFSGFINGEVVTIDGGEWLKGAGEFNLLDFLSQEQWDLMEAQVRGAGKSKPGNG